MRILIRADASTDIGAGHVMRCVALAEVLVSRGADVSFVCRELPGHYCDWLEQRGFPVNRLAYESTDPDADSAQCQAILSRVGALDWLVVDHYGLDVNWETALRPLTRKIFVIDDNADRVHDCDLLLDQNLVTQQTDRYSSLLPPGTQCLFGPRYAMLRPEFADARATRHERNGKVRRVLVCFGGSDPQGHTLATLRALRSYASCLDRIDVVVGLSNQGQTELAAVCAEFPNAVLHCQTDNMAALLAAADLAIGAGGTMNWERACLGVPTIAFGVAENQYNLLAALFEAGCAIGQATMSLPNEKAIARWISCMLDCPSLLRGMAQRSATLVDGLGVQRVADVLLENTVSSLAEQHTSIDILCSDPKHPIRPKLEAWSSLHPGAKLCTQSNDLRGGDFLFLISCQEIIEAPVRARYRHCLVVHASNLPRGRGMSPHVWQIIEGCNEITVSLLDAADPFDTGSIWSQQTFKLEGHELFDEINEALFACELELMDWALSYCDSESPKEQSGTPTYYRRRTPEESQLDPGKTLAEQFELLRIADPIRYPAFFYFRECCYQISLIKREGKPK